MKTYTIKEIAEILNCTIAQVHRLIESGRLQAINIATDTATRGRWRISEKALQRFLAGSC